MKKPSCFKSARSLVRFLFEIESELTRYVAGIHGANLHCDGVYVPRELARLLEGRPGKAHNLGRTHRHGRPGEEGVSLI